MNKNKKFAITLVCPRTPRLYSTGLENLTMQLARHFANNGHAVTIFTTAKHKTQRVVYQDISIHEFSGFAPKESYFFSWPFFVAMQQNDSEFVLVSGYNNFTTLLALLAKKPGQKLCIYLNASGAHSGFRKFLRVLFDKTIWLLHSRIDFVFFSSDSEAEQYQHLFGNVPSELLGLGIDWQRIENKVVPKESDRLLCVARLVKNKGFLDLLPGFALVVKKNPNAKLVIIGDGPDKQEFVDLTQKLGIQSHVVFKGAITDRETYLTELKKSTALILLLEFRAVSLVLLEGLAARIPVIVNKGASPVFAKKKYVTEIKNQKNPQQIAAVILNVLQNPKRFVPQKTEIFSWEQIGDKILKVFFELDSTAQAKKKQK